MKDYLLVCILVVGILIASIPVFSQEIISTPDWIQLSSGATDDPEDS